jgi:hypothetical protein
MNQGPSAPAGPSLQQLPRNVKVLGGASLLNDIASEMIFPLLPNFLLTVLLGNRFYLGVIEGTADSVASLLKLWSGGRSDQAGRRSLIFGGLYGWYNFAIGIATLPSSLIFGGLYQVFGALVAFGWGAVLAVVAVVLLTGVRDS